MIGIPSVIFCIYKGGILFSIFISIVIILGLKEFIDILYNKKIYISKPLMICSCAFLFLIRWLSYENFLELHLFLIFLILIISFLIEIFSDNKNSIESISMTLLGFTWIALSLNYLIDIRNDQGFYFTFSIILSVWACDTFAFVIGSAIGEKKILPKISPNKTWLGSIAGFFGSLILLFILFNYFPVLKTKGFSNYDIIAFSFITGLMGQLGDFSQSLIKRQLQIKDTSEILQGHGGILDRFDSLMFVVPLIYIYLYLWI